MSTVTHVPTGRPRADHPGRRLDPAEVAVVRRALGLVRKIVVRATPVAVAVIVGVAVIIANVSRISQSIWEVAGQWPRWWLFTAALLSLIGYLPILVAHGMTRRSAFRALAVAGVLTSLVWTGLMVVGHLIERFVYARLGWPDRMTTSHLFTNGYDVLPMLAEYELVFLAYLITGALVGAVYYRFGGVRGTLLLPLAGLPGIGVEALLTGWYGSEDRHGLSGSAGAAALLIGGSLALLLLGTLATYLVVRDLPIHGKK